MFFLSLKVWTGANLVGLLGMSGGEAPPLLPRVTHHRSYLGGDKGASSYA